MMTRVFIIPAAYRDAGNAMATAMGWGGPVFVQPLSANGKEPVTHWGFPSIVWPDFIETWDNPPEEAAPLVAATFTDDRDGDDTAGHWHDVIAGRGLKVVQVEAAVGLNMT